jgi:hypothetical protein
MFVKDNYSVYTALSLSDRRDEPTIPSSYDVAHLNRAGAANSYSNNQHNQQRPQKPVSLLMDTNSFCSGGSATTSI